MHTIKVEFIFGAHSAEVQTRGIPLGLGQLYGGIDPGSHPVLDDPDQFPGVGGLLRQHSHASLIMVEVGIGVGHILRDRLLYFTQVQAGGLQTETRGAYIGELCLVENQRIGAELEEGRRIRRVTVGIPDSRSGR